MIKQDKKESKVESIKRHSRQLRGTIAESLAVNATHFRDDDTHLLKPHGVYQQEHRDTRTERNKAGLEPEYAFMVRVALPGGRLTAQQYLELDSIADSCGNGSLRLTTRQGVQFHGIQMPRLCESLASINQRLMTTLGACGDVNRNVMACPAPLDDAAHVALKGVVQQIARELRPETRAYHEIWLGEEKLYANKGEEPFYGAQYLPRKFKTGVALDTDDCVDIFSYDCGLIAIIRDGKLQGFNVVAGGGMGMSHAVDDTFARLADPLAFVAADQGVEAVKAVAAVFRDHGNRVDRRRARLKYLITEWGIETFREAVAARVNFELQPYLPLPRIACHDHLGRHPQGGDRWFYGVQVANGRIHDTESVKVRSGLRELIARYRPAVHLTPGQNLLLVGLTEREVEKVEQVLADYGVVPVERLTGVRRYALACPALPTCGLAITESERVMPEVIQRFEHELTALGMEKEALALRMTGCPNGCARPYTADIALVGRKPGERYNVYVGGGTSADRLADLYAEDCTVDEAVAALRPLLDNWARHRLSGEPLGDFYQRLAENSAPRRVLTGAENPTGRRIALKVLA